MLLFSFFGALPFSALARAAPGNIPTVDPPVIDAVDLVNDTMSPNFTYLSIPSYRHHSAGPPQTCDNHDGFWDNENEEESEWGIALYQWTKNVDKESPEWLGRSSEASFFAQDVLGLENFDCGIGINNGCDQMPDCDTVLTRVVDKYDARRVMYVLQSYKHFTIRAVKLREAIPAVEHKMIGFANEMASVLYPKHDYVKEAECTMLSNIVKIGASILLSLPAAVVPFMAGPAAAAGAAGAGAAAGAAGVTTGMVASKVTSAANSAGLGFRNAISTRLSSMTKFVGNGLKSSSAGQLWSKGSAAATKWAKGPGRAAGLGKWLKAKATRGDKAWQKAKEVQSGPIGSMVSANAVTALLLFGADEFTNRICNRYPNPPPDLEPWYAMGGQMQGHALLENYGHEISDTTTEILAGVGFGPDGTFDDEGFSVLTDVIADGSYVQLTYDEEDKYYNRPYLLEEQLFEVFKRAQISMTLKLQMCYLSCTDNPLQPGPNRYDVGDGVWCQPQCWGRFGEDKNNVLYGLDWLDRNDLTMEFILGSYFNWRDFRYGNNPELPRVPEHDRLLKAVQGDFLPVCFSRAMPPRSMDHPGAENNRQTLPCVCGNDVGNETMVFFRETNMDVMLNGETNDALIRACQWGADEQEVLPSLTFIMQCDIGFHWPYHGEKHSHRMKAGPDPACGRIIDLQKTMLSRGLTLEDVNCELCDEEGDFWQEITERQNDHHVLREQDMNAIIGVFEKFLDLLFHTRDASHYNLKYSCQRFRQKHWKFCNLRDSSDDWNKLVPARTTPLRELCKGTQATFIPACWGIETNLTVDSM